MGEPLATTTPPESRLVRAARDGDPAALEALARAWWAPVRRWALLDLGDPSLADDAAQEALVRMVRHIGTCDPDRPFAPWLRRVVQNCCHDVRRKRGRIAQVIDLPQRPRMDRELDLARVARRAVAAFKDLTPRQREVLDLCDRRGLRPVEAAEQLGIAPGTVRALLFQARRELRRRLLADRPEILELLRER